jgi:hypothetical protein
MILFFIGGFCMCTICIVCGAYVTHCFFQVNVPYPSEIEKGICGVQKKRYVE